MEENKVVVAFSIDFMMSERENRTNTVRLVLQSMKTAAERTQKKHGGT